LTICIERNSIRNEKWNHFYIIFITRYWIIICLSYYCFIINPFEIMRWFIPNYFSIEMNRNFTLNSSNLFRLSLLNLIDNNNSLPPTASDIGANHRVLRLAN
jgi:hypothetical protein